MDQIATNDAKQNNKKRTILLLIILLVLVVDFCISFGELSSVESESTILEPDFPQMQVTWSSSVILPIMLTTLIFRTAKQTPPFKYQPQSACFLSRLGQAGRECPQ